MRTSKRLVNNIMNKNAMKIIDNDLNREKSLSEQLLGSDNVLELCTSSFSFKRKIEYVVRFMEIIEVKRFENSYLIEDEIGINKWTEIDKNYDPIKVVKKFFKDPDYIFLSLFIASEDYFIILNGSANIVIYSKNVRHMQKIKKSLLSENKNLILCKNYFLVDSIRSSWNEGVFYDYAPSESVTLENIDTKMSQRLSIFDDYEEAPLCQNIRQPENPLYVRVELREQVEEDDLETILLLANASSNVKMVYHGIISQNKQENHLIRQRQLDGNYADDFVSLQSFIEEINTIPYCLENFEKIVYDSSVFIDENFIFGIYDSGINFIFQDINQKNVFIERLEGNDYIYTEYNNGGDMYKNNKIRIMYEIGSAIKDPKFAIQRLLIKLKSNNLP